MGAQHSHLLYQIPSPPSYNEELANLSWVESEGLRVPFVFHEWRGKEDQPAVFTILYVGSNYQDLGGAVSWLQTLQLTLQVNFAAFDYPGYGLHSSEQEPSEKLLFQCFSVVYQHLRDSLHIPADRIIIVSKNLGTSVAINLFSDSKVSKGQDKLAAGLVLVTPFTSLAHVVGSTKMKMARHVDLYDSQRKAEKVNVPTFAAHGLHDEVIDIKLGRKLANRVPDLWQMLEIEGGHHDIDYSDDLADELIAFVDYLGESVPEYQPRVLKEKEVPSYYRREATVDHWLESLGLAQYSQTFLMNGYFSMDIVRTMQELDIQAMGIADEDVQRTLLHSIEEMRQLSSPSQSRHSSSASKQEKQGSTTEEPSESDESDSFGSTGPDSRSVVYGPMEVDADSFQSMLEFFDGSPPAASENSKLTKKWNSLMAYASSVNIPYWENDDDEILSCGFFGQVVRSTWKDQPVIKRRLHYKKSQFRCFCRDALILCQLKHPHIVQVIGACMERDVPPTLVTEYVPQGRTLAQVLDNQPDLSRAERLNLAVGVASGLVYLHTCSPSIVHRDLTANNVLVTPGMEAKLSDFGMGRPPAFLYMSPELFCKQPYGPSGDVYSFGLLLFYIITGRRPFEGLSGAEAAAKAAKLHVRPVIPDSVPEEWRDLIQSCWHRNPMQRPTSEQVYDRLSEWTSSRDESSKDEVSHSGASEDEAKSSSSARRSLEVPPKYLLDTSIMDVSSEIFPQKAVECPAGGVGRDAPPSALMQYQFGTLLSDPKYSDMVILCEADQSEIPVHRAILAARSEILASRIEEAGESRKLVVRSEEATPDAMRNLLQFIYTGKVHVRNNTLYDLMEAARHLGLVQVLDVCREFVEKNGIPLSSQPAVTRSPSGSLSAVASPARQEDESPSLHAVDSLKDNINHMEENIFQVEDVLNSLHAKLETITTRMAHLPTVEGSSH